MKNIIINIFIIVLVSILPYKSGSCQENPIEAKNKIINNDKPQWGKESRVSLEFVRKIGGLDAVDENYAFSKIKDICFDNDGSIFVLDAGNFRIQKLSSEGDFLQTIGGFGQDPGEFEDPVSMDIDDNGILVVADRGLERYTKMKANGEFVKTFDINVKSMFYGKERIKKEAEALRILASGDIVTGTTRDNWNPTWMGLGPIFRIYNDESKILNDFGKPRDFEDFMLNKRANRINWIVDDFDNIYSSFVFQNRIEKYSSKGELIFSATRKLEFKPEYLKTILEKNARGGVQGIFTTIPDQITCGLSLDYENRLWVLTYFKELPKYKDKKSNIELVDEKFRKNIEKYIRFEIYNNDGLLLGYIKWTIDYSPNYYNSIFVNNDRLYIVEVDGVAIHEYKILENQ